MLKIGEISGFCGVPVKTLRYYNKIDLLKPHYIDPFTKYRFYGEDQLKRLVTILDLRDIGFTLEKISLYLENSSNTEIVLDLIKSKTIEIEETIKREQLKLENLKLISSRFSVQAYKDSQNQNEKITEVFNELNEKITTLDTCTSIERHTLEEVIWL